MDNAQEANKVEVSQEPKAETQVVAEPKKELQPEQPVAPQAEAPAKPKKKIVRRKILKAVKIEAKAEAKPFPNYRQNILVFGRWSSQVEIKDLGLRNYINLTPVFAPYTAGRAIKKQFWKSKKSIIERLAAKLMVSGHKGKKHFYSSGKSSGKIATHYRLLVNTFDAIEKKVKKNPIEILVRALEAGTPREGVATIEYGGVRYPKAADLAPQRRIDLALRWLVQGAFIASRRNKKEMFAALADELIATAAGDVKSNCITKKVELERQAAASR